MAKEMSIEEWSDFLINLKEKSELQQKIGERLDFVNWPVVSKKYLHKQGWITDHLIGYLRTGEKVPAPTDEEYKQLKSALLEMSKELKDVSDRL